MRRGIAPGPRRRDEAVLNEVRASLDNEGPGARTPAAVGKASAAAATLLTQAAWGFPKVPRPATRHLFMLVGRSLTATLHSDKCALQRSPSGRG
jgi:hypothetical protein